MKDLARPNTSSAKPGMLRRRDGVRNGEAVADQGDSGHGFNHRDAVRRDDF